MSKKRFYVLVIAVIAALVVTLAGCGDKGENNDVPLEGQTVNISTAEELAGLKDYVGIKYSEYTFVLQNDISLAEYTNWEPIGVNLLNAFMGTFDGNGHTISGLTIYGMDENYAPIKMSERIENTTSYFAAGLFGYLSSAEIKNLTLTDFDIRYYIDKDFGYTGAVAGYCVGDTTFSDITVSGDIQLSNIYEQYRTYDEKGAYQSLGTRCNATSYIGGVAAYAKGNVKFSNIDSSVNIGNENYVAYYKNADSSPDGETDYEEGYVVQTTYGLAALKPEQLFVGGVVGYIKGGSAQDCSYVGYIDVCGKNAYSAGIAGAMFDAKVSDSEVTGATITAVAHNKNVGAGISALVDNGGISDCSVANLNLTLNHGGSIQALTAGGIFGYLCNLAVVENSDSANLNVTVTTQNSNVGGIGGVVRNANMIGCDSSNATFRLDAFTVDVNSYSKITTIVSAVYGTSLIKDCTGNGRNATDRSGNYAVNTSTYFLDEELTYVDEEGNRAVRIYEKGSIDNYLTITGSLNEDNTSLKITAFDEELTEIASWEFAGNYSSADNLAETYLDVWFEAGVGIKASGATISGRNLANYEYRSGKATFENVVLSE